MARFYLFGGTLQTRSKEIWSCRLSPKDRGGRSPLSSGYLASYRVQYFSLMFLSILIESKAFFYFFLFF